MSLATKLFLNRPELRVEEVKVWETPNSLNYLLTSLVLLKVQATVQYNSGDIQDLQFLYTVIS